MLLKTKKGNHINSKKCVCVCVRVYTGGKDKAIVHVVCKSENQSQSILEQRFQV